MILPTYTQHTTTRLGTGALILFVKEPGPLTAYDADPAPTLGPSMLVVYVDADAVSSYITNLGDLLSVARVRDIDLAAALDGQEYEFATIASRFLDTGRVIVPSELWDHVVESYGIDIKEHQPRIDGHALHFASRRSPLYTPPDGRLDFNPPLFEHTLDLYTMAYQARVLAYPHTP